MLVHICPHCGAMTEAMGEADVKCLGCGLVFDGEDSLMDTPPKLPGPVEPTHTCQSCRHPEGDCGGDFVHKDDAAEFVADSYEPPDYD